MLFVRRRGCEAILYSLQDRVKGEGNFCNYLYVFYSANESTMSDRGRRTRWSNYPAQIASVQSAPIVHYRTPNPTKN
jgi:hypothetical protein